MGAGCRVGHVGVLHSTEELCQSHHGLPKIVQNLCDSEPVATRLEPKHSAEYVSTQEETHGYQDLASKPIIDIR